MENMDEDDVWKELRKVQARIARAKVYEAKRGELRKAEEALEVFHKARTDAFAALKDYLEKHNLDIPTFYAQREKHRPHLPVHITYNLFLEERSDYNDALQRVCEVLQEVAEIGGSSTSVASLEKQRNGLLRKLHSELCQHGV